MAVAGLALAFAVNMGALVWGASKITTTVNFQTKLLSGVQDAQSKIVSELNKIHTRVTVLENNDRMERERGRTSA